MARSPTLAAMMALSLYAMVPTAALAQANQGSVAAPPAPQAKRRSIAESVASEQRHYHLTLYGSRWAEMNLPEFPLRLVTLDIPLRDAYFVSLGGAYVLLPNFSLPLGLFDMHGCDFEVDAQVVKHFGAQSHVEGSFALIFRTGDATIDDSLAINFAVGEGMSLAASQPAYEKGPGGKRGVDSRRLQNHLLFELELTAPTVPFVHLVLRLHHRSGIYGLISPQRTGSNYLGAGLRMDG